MGVYIEDVQKWLNKTYVGKDGFIPIQENGETGWETTNALLVALQIELGISSSTVENEINTGLYSFGTETMNACPNISANTELNTPSLQNISRILQGGFWCKGIYPGPFQTELTAEITTAINTLQQMAGIAQTGVAGYLEFRALLSMDAFVAIDGGDPNVVAIQREINGKYAYQMQQLIPCDGIIDRTMQSALLFVLEMLDGFPAWACRYALQPSNFGYFAPNLLTATPTINIGNASPYALLLQQTLYCNGYKDIVFTGVYDEQTAVCVNDFKNEMILSGGTAVNGETWESLLTSHGYSGRPARACDTAQTLTLSQAQALKSAGYEIVGRYLTDKFAMTSEEISNIFEAGLSIFPIFETYGTYSAYFTTSQGITDAKQAVNAAQGLGIPEGTIIYFGVDCDILDDDVSSTVIPYFQGINNQFEAMGNPYKIGVYGARHICTETYNAGLTVTSFVLDMSTGYSGNIMNFSMPENWAFNQFATVYVDGVGIDKDGYSGKDKGFNVVEINNIIGEQQLLNEFNSIFGIDANINIFKEALILCEVPEFTVTLQASTSINSNGGDKINISEDVTLSVGSIASVNLNLKTLQQGLYAFASETLVKNISEKLYSNGVLKITFGISNINPFTVNYTVKLTKDDFAVNFLISVILGEDGDTPTDIPNVELVKYFTGITTVVGGAYAMDPENKLPETLEVFMEKLAEIVSGGKLGSELYNWVKSIVPEIVGSV